MAVQHVSHAGEWQSHKPDLLGSERVWLARLGEWYGHTCSDRLGTWNVVWEKSMDIVAWIRDVDCGMEEGYGDINLVCVYMRCMCE